MATRYGMGKFPQPGIKLMLPATEAQSLLQGSPVSLFLKEYGKASQKAAKLFYRVPSSKIKVL